MDTPSTAVGTDRLIADRFRVTDVIARGGMAVVYRARDERLGRDVAVKVVDLRSDLDGRSRQRISLEAKRTASLRHPNIVSVHDAGSDGDQAFIVMELVDGEPLGDVLEERGRLTETEAAAIGAEVCKALAEAHRRGIVHRDIKPSNVLLDDDGRVQVTDFGIARANAGETVTEHHPMGSAPYIAPEQLTGDGVDGRADLYALGVLLYETVTGRLPFVGDTTTATAWQRLHRDPASPELHADLPAGLGPIIERALQREPGDRYESASEMQRDLERVARSRIDDTVTMPVIEGASRRAPWRTLAVALVGVLALAAGSVMFWSGTVESTAADEVRVPQVTGVSLDAAERLLRLRDLQVGNIRRVPSDRPAETVLEQAPGDGSDVARGTSIELTVSAGGIDVRTTAPSTAARTAQDGVGDDAETTEGTDATTADEPETGREERPGGGRRDDAPGHGTPPGHTDREDGRGPPG